MNAIITYSDTNFDEIVYYGSSLQWLISGSVKLHRN